MMECNDLFNKKHPKKIDSYYQLIRDELNKIKKYQGTRIEIVDVDCDDNNECLKMYDNIRENYGYEPLNYIDDNEKIESENNNKILIKTKEFIYVAYMLSKASNLMLLRWMAKTEKDGENQQIIKFKTFKKASKNAEELSGCFAEIAAANSQQCQDKARGKIKLTIQEQQQLFNNIIDQYYPKANIEYVEYLTDEDAYNAYDKIKMCINLPKSVDDKVVREYDAPDSSDSEGNGLRNAGLYDNIKEFINFRKDTKETLYYLLQRIIALENDMKTVKNKIVSNNIRTTFKDRNINLSDEDDDEDNNANARQEQGNGFMCSRCGMINPKFFKNDYPTLSEFREQFSKL